MNREPRGEAPPTAERSWEKGGDQSQVPEQIPAHRMMEEQRWPIQSLFHSVKLTRGDGLVLNGHSAREADGWLRLLHRIGVLCLCL